MSNYKVTLRAARVNVDLRQEDVCNILHISKTTIVNWEKKNNVDKKTLIALCDIYKVPEENIFLNE